MILIVIELEQELLIYVSYEKNGEIKDYYVSILVNPPYSMFSQITYFADTWKENLSYIKRYAKYIMDKRKIKKVLPKALKSVVAGLERDIEKNMELLADIAKLKEIIEEILDIN